MTQNDFEDAIQVVVYDDDDGSARDIAERLARLAHVQVSTLQNPRDQISLLEERRRRARDGATDDGQSQLDGADVFIVDYDLTLTDEEGPAETGERVAYLARAYSSAAVVVALNQFEDVATFDLSLLGHPASFADLNLSGDQIDNPALWGFPSDGFSPASWPNLRTLPSLHQRQAKVILNNLDEFVLSLFSTQDRPIAAGMQRAQLAWLTKGQPKDATVGGVADDSRLGLKPGDRFHDGDEGRARFVASRLNKWIREVVLPYQSVLVDAGHLVTRFPSLAAEDLEPGSNVVVSQAADPHRYAADFPLGQHLWHWPSIVEDQSVLEVGDPFAAIEPNVQFCEDSSAFRRQEDCRSFLADVTPFGRRFVTREARADEQDRAPWAGPHGLGSVIYEPAIHFAL